MRRMNVPVAHLGSMDYVPHLIARLCSSGNSACLVVASTRVCHGIIDKTSFITLDYLYLDMYSAGQVRLGQFLF